jgi:hypothetical protein
MNTGEKTKRMGNRHVVDALQRSRNSNNSSPTIHRFDNCIRAALIVLRKLDGKLKHEKHDMAVYRIVNDSEDTRHVFLSLDMSSIDFQRIDGSIIDQCVKEYSNSTDHYHCICLLEKQTPSFVCQPSELFLNPRPIPTGPQTQRSALSHL